MDSRKLRPQNTRKVLLLEFGLQSLNADFPQKDGVRLQDANHSHLNVATDSPKLRRQTRAHLRGREQRLEVTYLQTVLRRMHKVREGVHRGGPQPLRARNDHRLQLPGMGDFLLRRDLRPFPADRPLHHEQRRNVRIHRQPLRGRDRHR